MKYRFNLLLWQYPGMGGWHFVTIDGELAIEIKNRYGHLKRGWGSLPVWVGVGKSRWKTSIFPDKRYNGYLLPVKKDIREKEEWAAEERREVVIEVIE